MEFLSALLFLLGGFSLLVFGGDFLVKSAVSLASRFKVNPAVIGATVIAGGTSAPEMMTSAMASLKGSADIAIGNVVGSNTFNFLAIIGISSLFNSTTIHPHTARFDYPILLFVTAAFLIAGWDGVFLKAEGLVFLAAMVFYLVMSFAFSKPGEDSEEIETLKSPLYDFVYLVLGFAGLLGGAELALRGGISLGQIAGLSERVIGITIISVGTGLPELAASTMAALRGRSEMAIANVVGSNILNILGVVGISASLIQLQAQPSVIQVDGLLMAGFSLFLLIPILASINRLGRLSGSLFLLIYTGYVAFLLSQ